MPKLPPGTVDYEHVAFPKNLQKVVKTRFERGPQTGWLYSLVTLTAIHFPIAQNQRFKLPVDRRRVTPPRCPSQKSIIFRTNERTDERTNISFSSLPDGKSASRNYHNFLRVFLTRHDTQISFILGSRYIPQTHSITTLVMRWQYNCYKKGTGRKESSTRML